MSEKVQVFWNGQLHRDDMDSRIAKWLGTVLRNRGFEVRDRIESEGRLMLGVR